MRDLRVPPRSISRHGQVFPYGLVSIDHSLDVQYTNSFSQKKEPVLSRPGPGIHSFTGKSKHSPPRG